MKFLLVSHHASENTVPMDENFVHEFRDWIDQLHPIAMLPVEGGKTVTSKNVEDYKGDIGGALIFEAENLDEAIEKAKKSPGLQYGWTHDVLIEMKI